MATKMTVVHECKKCGTEVTVNSAGLKSITPIYCCGRPLFETKRVVVKTAKTRIDKIVSGKQSDREETVKTLKRAGSKSQKKRGSSAENK
jgi:hypothetical protein